MATSYPIPAWINQPTDTAEDFSRGLALGAQIQESQNRIAIAAQNSAMEAELRSRQIEAQAFHDQQQIEVTKAYHDQQLMLQKERLDQVNAINQMKTADAARKFAAQEAYRQRVVSGENPAAVGLELGPSMGMPMGGMASLYKAAQPKPVLGEPSVQNYGGQQFLRVPRPNGDIFQQIKQGGVTPEGPLQARPVVLNGKTIPGMIAVPSVSGPLVAHNIPGNEYGRMKDTLKRMEDGKWGRYLKEGRVRQDWTDQQKAEFKSVQQKYDTLQMAMEQMAEKESESPAATVPAPAAADKTNNVLMSEELENARKAIKDHKVPRAIVAKKFKDRTGRDLPDNIP